MPKLKFLVIEDDLFYQSYVNDLLAETGVDILTASDGEAGLRLAFSEKPDLILSDIEIPKIQGFVLLRNLRENPETRDIPMILMSGKVEKDLLERHSHLKVHASGYLMKPFSGQDLINLIREVLGPEVDFGSEGKTPEKEEFIPQETTDDPGVVPDVFPDTQPDGDAFPETVSRSPLHVLVVDDSQYICDIASDFLKEIGVEVTTALNGEDGLKIALSIRPDMVFLDVQMPKMNGFVVCEMLRKEETTKDIPIILMSAVVDGESFERHSKLRYHADAYIQKPFMKSELQELVERYYSLGSLVRSPLEQKAGFLVPTEDEIFGEGGRAFDPSFDNRIREQLKEANEAVEQLEGKGAELEERLQNALAEKDRFEEELFQVRSGQGVREKELQDKLTLVTQRFEEIRERLEQIEKEGRETSDLQERLEALSGELEEEKSARSILENENKTLKDEIEYYLKHEKQVSENTTEEELSAQEDHVLSREIEGLKRDLTAALSAKAEIEEQAGDYFKGRGERDKKEQSLKDELEKSREENRSLLERIARDQTGEKVSLEVESKLEKAREEIRELNEKLREKDGNREVEGAMQDEKLSAALEKLKELEEEKAAFEEERAKFQIQLDEARKMAADETAARIELEGLVETAGQEKRLIASELEETRKLLNEEKGGIRHAGELRRELEEEKNLRASAEADLRELRKKQGDLENAGSRAADLEERCEVLKMDLDRSERVRGELEQELRKRHFDEGNRGVEANLLNERLKRLETTFTNTVQEAQEVITSQKNRENDLRQRLDTLVDSLSDEKEALSRERDRWRKKEEELRFAFEDALAENRRIIGEEASRFFPMHVPRETRPLEVVTGKRKLMLGLVMAAVFLLVFFTGYVVLSWIGSEKEQAPVQEAVTVPSPGDRREAAPRPDVLSITPEETPSYEDVWRRQTVQSVSEDMVIQATFHTRRELETAILYTASKEGWTRERREKYIDEVVATYDLKNSIFITIFTKNLKGGYPGYADGFERHVALRDETGRETMGSLPAELEGKKFITSRISAAGKEMNPVFLYEVGITVAFSRDELAENPDGLQLVLYDVGAVPVRVLTWDLSTMGPLSSRPLILAERNS